ncbi:uncharacterized protein N7503_008705 [Penicillium pulvis]|uniref:uncharacterized protein n=1 Tax=Penicillium pulvis TaxID=1562058 RepID=UPI002546E10E|nr:uncharacterized protein N7503_008705 [Penicillium pulvis]KAJ5792727.1 hypothetical protein N7503_008705 [Penicillium pulvis]
MDHLHPREKAGGGDSLQDFSREVSRRARGFIRSEILGTRSIGRFRGYTSESDSSDGQIDKSGVGSVKLTGSRRKNLGSASKPGQPQPPSLPLSSSSKRSHNKLGKVDDVSDRSPSTTAPTVSAQKVGHSILVKREDQLNVPLNTTHGLSIGTSVLESIDLDDMISRLLDAGISHKPTKNVCLENAEINALCLASQELLLSQPTLLELSSPLKIVGDLHGQYIDLIRLFGMCGFPPASNYLFLGNYVNQGKQSLETILLLLCYKLKYPENFFLLRGNHECANSPRMCGFYGECKRRCNLEIWNTFINTFNCLPIASIVAEKIFCVHGGLSPGLSHIDDIRRIARPTDVPDDGLLDDLLRSDPDDKDEAWSPNERGMSGIFGKKVTMNFLQRHDFDLICRGHMVVENGFEFSQDRMLVTLFSAPCYRGDFDNLGAIMSVSDDFLCNFEILKPLNSTILKRQRRLKRDEKKERWQIE